jgi:ethanolamine ammonia-lyase large subunit
MQRRTFLKNTVLVGLSLSLAPRLSASIAQVALSDGVSLAGARKNEDLFAYMSRIHGGFDRLLYGKILGAANEFKEGDAIAGLAAADSGSRETARQLIANTRIMDVRSHSVFTDNQSVLIAGTVKDDGSLNGLTFGELKRRLLLGEEVELKRLGESLTSDEIAVVVKLMSNEELIALSRKIFNPLPGSKIGSKGYMGARVQPNSPTDHPEDIFWQVMDAWSYAVGDVVLGTNPVSSEVEQVTRIEEALKDIIDTFGLQDTLPHCVLAHIDVQAKAEKLNPGTTGIWFQSLAGTDNANQTFDLSIDKLRERLNTRQGKFGFYAETGQGADETNGHDSGFDLLIHESRKYGLIRAAKMQFFASLPSENPWVFANDVAGFIGPEVFKTKEQLVRCCLEDLVMGKLHGLALGLDICTTLHMDVSLDDLDWCIDQIMPANPAYLMALPTKNDPMLSYLTTSFADHVSIRHRFGYKVNDEMWSFFKSLGVISEDGKPAVHFGDPVWVYMRYCRNKGDQRDESIIRKEGEAAIERVRKRGVPISVGTGAEHWMPPAELDQEIRRLYADAKYCLWQELDSNQIKRISNSMVIQTQSISRMDYVNHPATGEVLSVGTVFSLEGLRKEWAHQIPDVQVIISDGLNVNALFDENHLEPFLEHLHRGLTDTGFSTSRKNVIIRHGRVRAGYRCGEILFGSQSGTNKKHTIIHIIGERPGTEHRNFSVYVTCVAAGEWANSGRVDHDLTRVVSGISDTAFKPELAAREVVDLCIQLKS